MTFSHSLIVTFMRALSLKATCLQRPKAVGLGAHQNYSIGKLYSIVKIGLQEATQVQMKRKKGSYLRPFNLGDRLLLADSFPTLIWKRAVKLFERMGIRRE